MVEGRVTIGTPPKVESAEKNRSVRARMGTDAHDALDLDVVLGERTNGRGNILGDVLEGPGGQMLANGLIRLALLKLRVREPMTMNASVRGLPAWMAGGKPGLEVGQLGAGAFALRTARGWIGEIKSVWGRIGKIRNVRRRTGSGRALYTHSTLTRSTGHRRWRCSVVFGSGALRKVIRKWLSINRGIFGQLRKLLKARKARTSHN
ncbi:hypothetical protein EDB80DRAFT_699505 [Ilyonectria destructans]|nr:hypothetical protein EDB80DRAFT_742332 [Ilyonectria destructans]KAH6974772.1 hypothetical protein EDB80DRAFT_741588 [Ilyonectria destructans]KAH6976629.1 hypothetical protein EDB80DRAFT_739923 [Ilyonectria destructans]KAH7018919.1 hypothetical protein EDB80DRAFT_699505 [Ilyonectria destructans]